MFFCKGYRVFNRTCYKKEDDCDDEDDTDDVDGEDETELEMIGSELSEEEYDYETCSDNSPEESGER